jgi:hypothetical protein
MMIPTVAVFLDVHFYNDYLLILVFFVIVISFLLLYGIYIVNIVYLRKNHPISYVLTPILFSMDFVPCNFPYSLASIFAIVLFILFMRDIRKKQEGNIESTKS